MEWEPLLRRWAAWMRAGQMSEDTIRLRVYHLSRLARSLPDPASVTTDDLIDWLDAKDWKPNTRRSYRASFTAFWKWAVKTGRLEGTPAAELPYVKVPRARPRPTPEAVFRFGLRIADPRTRLALMLGGVCGLRRGEMARARKDDLERDLEGWCLRVTGKGGHVRLVPLPEELARVIRAAPEGWLFPSPGGGHLTPGHIYVLVKRALETHSTHTLRHRAGTLAYARSRDLRAVQELLGHAKPETTAIYTDVGPRAIRDAMEGALPDAG